LLEEGRLRLELAVTAAFDATRSLLRTLLFLPRKPKWGAPGAGRGTSAFEGDWRSWERRAAWGRARPRGLRDRLLARSGRGIGRLEDLQVWTASDCILQVGAVGRRQPPQRWGEHLATRGCNGTGHSCCCCCAWQ
jgi:hypothetical protein